MNNPAYDVGLETEAIKEWTAEQLELGMSQLTEAELSALFVEHFDDDEIE